MKKTLKTLSVLAFGSMIALSGASYAKAYTNVSTTSSVDTQVACDTQITTMCGDINTSTGMTIVNEEITLYSYNPDTNITEEYTADFKVIISSYETATDPMANGYDIDWSLTITSANWTDSGTGNANDSVRLLKQMQVLVTVNDGNPFVYGISYDAATNTFTSQTDAVGSDNVMDFEKSNSTLRITVINDPTATSNAIHNGTDSNTLDWQNSTTRTAYTNTWNLADLDSTISENDKPITYGNQDITYNETDNTLDIEFNLYLNGYDLDGITTEADESSGPNSTSLNVSGYLMIPYTKIVDGTELTYFYSVLITGATMGGVNNPYSFITYDDGLHNDGAANDGNYRVVLASHTVAATETAIDLEDVVYYTIDPYDAGIDGTPSTAYSFIYPIYTGGATSQLINGDLSNETIDAVADDDFTVNYEDSFFIPQLNLTPVDENGDQIAGFANATTFIQSDSTYTPPVYTEWTMGAGLISLIVIGSVALAAGIGFGGWYYSHKMHLKGKYDHMHLDRLKAHVAKLEKTVAMDDKKAAEWDAKHHINHKDTKKKK